VDGGEEEPEELCSPACLLLLLVSLSHAHRHTNRWNRWYTRTCFLYMRLLSHAHVDMNTDGVIDWLSSSSSSSWLLAYSLTPHLTHSHSFTHSPSHSLTHSLTSPVSQVGYGHRERTVCATQHSALSHPPPSPNITPSQQLQYVECPSLPFPPSPPLLSH